MKKLTGLAFLFFFVMLFAMPLAIAEDMKQMPAPEEKVVSSEEPGEGVVTGTVVDLNTSARTISVKILDRSEEHTSELQSHSFISYAVFCLKKKRDIITYTIQNSTAL